MRDPERTHPHRCRSERIGVPFPRRARGTIALPWIGASRECNAKGDAQSTGNIAAPPRAARARRGRASAARRSVVDEAASALVRRIGARPTFEQVGRNPSHNRRSRPRGGSSSASTSKDLNRASRVRAFARGDPSLHRYRRAVYQGYLAPPSPPFSRVRSHSPAASPAPGMASDPQQRSWRGAACVFEATATAATRRSRRSRPSRRPDAGAPLALLEAKVLRNEYPAVYAPQRDRRQTRSSPPRDLPRSRPSRRGCGSGVGRIRRRARGQLGRASALARHRRARARARPRGAH